VKNLEHVRFLEIGVVVLGGVQHIVRGVRGLRDSFLALLRRTLNEPMAVSFERLGCQVPLRLAETHSELYVGCLVGCL
jgi:hypothetical protein